MKPYNLLLAAVWILIWPAQEIKAQWVATNGPYSGGVIRCLAVSGSVIFAGADSGLFRSNDNGTSWTPVNNGLTSRYVNAMLVNGPEILLAGTSYGIFLSTNNGTSWLQTSSISDIVSAFTISPNGSGGKTLFAGTMVEGLLLFTLGGGVWRSTNNGTTWTDISKSQRMDVNALVIAPNGDLLAGATPFTYWLLLVPFQVDGGIFHYMNDGTSWRASNAGLTNTSVNCLAVNSTNVFAGTGGGVFLSTNNGASWTVAGLTNVNVRALAISGTSLFAGTNGGGVFLSTNNGTS